MAVLRANALWYASVPANARVTPLPWEEETPEVRVTQTVFTCPVGKRGILRGMTTVPSTGLGGNDDASHVYSVVTLGDGMEYAFHRHWWKSETGLPYKFVATDHWYGMLVIQPNCAIRLWNNGTHVLTSTGSGMFVDA